MKLVLLLFFFFNIKLLILLEAVWILLQRRGGEGVFRPRSTSTKSFSKNCFFSYLTCFSSFFGELNPIFWALKWRRGRGEGRGKWLADWLDLAWLGLTWFDWLWRGGWPWWWILHVDALSALASPVIMGRIKNIAPTMLQDCYCVTGGASYST